MPDIKILTETELRNTIPLDIKVIDCIESAFSELASGKVIMPPILSMPIKEYNGEIDVKTAYLSNINSFALKASPGFFDNHYPCQVHGVGMCDEWPFIPYPDKDYSNGDYTGVFEENMVICVESYIGEVGGKQGVKLENQYLVTSNGLKIFNSSLPLNLI